jgi:hypothetical protein
VGNRQFTFPVHFKSPSEKPGVLHCNSKSKVMPQP